MLQIINCIEINKEEVLLDSLDEEKKREVVILLQEHVMIPLGFIRTA